MGITYKLKFLNLRLSLSLETYQGGRRVERKGRYGENSVRRKKVDVGVETEPTEKR